MATLKSIKFPHVSTKDQIIGIIAELLIKYPLDLPNLGRSFTATSVFDNETL